MTLATARAIKHMIDVNFDRNISLCEISEKVGLSRFQVTRVFQKHFQSTPYRYQIRARMDRAIALLTDGEPIAETAVAVGFVDQSHMTRHFRKQFGTTPQRFIAGR